MALRFIRSNLPTSLGDPLQAAISTTTLVKDVISGIKELYDSPLTAPISIVLLILKTVQPPLNVVQDIQKNQAPDCVAMAWRATQILVDVDLKMRGRWDSAPERMMQSLQKFEGILKHIHEFMKSLSESKWGNQVLQENSIEDALGEYARLIDDAAQSLQLAALIDLHDSVGTLTQSNAENIEDRATALSHIEAPPPFEKKGTEDSSIQERHIGRNLRSRL